MAFLVWDEGLIALKLFRYSPRQILYSTKKYISIIICHTHYLKLLSYKYYLFCIKISFAIKKISYTI